MEGWQRERYLLHSHSQRYRRRLEESQNIIKEILTIVERPYVAFSCGKDSSVLADLALTERSDIPLRMLVSGETRLIHNIDDVMDYFKAKGAIIEELLIDRVFSDEWREANWTEQRKAGKHDIATLNHGDWDSFFLGLRAEESPPRKKSLYIHQTKGLPSFCYRYKATGDMIRICPLTKWTTEDIGAYLVSHDIPLLRTYIHQGLQARTTARLTGDAVRNYALSDIKRHDPQAWNKLVQRFPELRSFV